MAVGWKLEHALTVGRRSAARLKRASIRPRDGSNKTRHRQPLRPSYLDRRRCGSHSGHGVSRFAVDAGHACVVQGKLERASQCVLGPSALRRSDAEHHRVVVSFEKKGFGSGAHDHIEIRGGSEDAGSMLLRLTALGSGATMVKRVVAAVLLVVLSGAAAGAQSWTVEAGGSLATTATNTF